MYHLPMEQLLQTLENIGICPETIAAIRAAGDIENALILMMDDDRYEYWVPCNSYIPGCTMPLCGSYRCDHARPSGRVLFTLVYPVARVEPCATVRLAGGFEAHSSTWAHMAPRKDLNICSFAYVFSMP